MFIRINHHVIFQAEEQWQEAPPKTNKNDDDDDDAPTGSVVKGPTMPSQADLEQMVRKNETNILD